MEEKRKYPRYGCCPGRNFVARHENKKSILGEIKDFSRGGICFDSKNRLNTDDQLGLDLEIDGLDQKMPAGIQIRWCKKNKGRYTYGARLVNMNPGSKFDIMDLLYQDWRKNLNSSSLLS
ncbi:MAG: PilZ domain-containing protein [Candidatus Omnitrophica bacterium]|nr:PilZ domain-containing protein [Candidatus Omnitrophota bacterium]MDD5351969.1 PilZ domain-containing protein [Candidatus Omnitrophota bacterium]MDD5550795.1 PilZ domain-containing protein [Candidatus Omnitrophota bacterium]